MYECKILHKLKKIERKLEKIMSAVSDYATRANLAFTNISASLDNIVTDEANLAKQISDLVAQIAAGGSVLIPADQTALDTLAAAGDALATKTKSIADAVPDLPAPPPAV
jgi:hypothetical protein